MWRRPLCRYALYACLFHFPLLFSCDESLPPYNPPQNILSAKLSVVEQASLRQIRCPIPRTPIWDVPAMVFRISVANQYNETLQGPAGT
ncbi:MAG: hypothetical protein ACRENG_25260, partial [bacterium]